MIVGLDLWYRFSSLTYWWMHVMIGVWLIFALMLFVAVPPLPQVCQSWSLHSSSPGGKA